jgi:hypothetical protein
MSLDQLSPQQLAEAVHLSSALGVALARHLNAQHEANLLGAATAHVAATSSNSSVEQSEAALQDANTNLIRFCTQHRIQVAGGRDLQSAAFNALTALSQLPVPSG